MNKEAGINRYIRDIALSEGALLVGFTQIRRAEPVVLLAFPFSEKWFFKAPGVLTKILGRAHAKSKNAHNRIQHFLAKEGYNVHQKTVLSIYGDYRPLARSAGIGEWGRNGLIVNKDYGSNMLFSALFTNAPLDVDTPVEKSQDYCRECTRCIDSCPAKAFENNTFHLSRCLPKALKGCYECLKACTGK
ncbi:MAG: 4Fe-4S ferredoxin [Clostridia bacterium]|nr:4Fe-4S ferredoxin [Clostridia bacterium]